MLALLLVGLLATQPTTDLLRLEDSPIGAVLPIGWKLREVSGTPLPDFSIREEAGQRAFTVQSRGAAAWTYRTLEVPIATDSGKLYWTWRVLEHPAAADLGRRASDDSPLRIYVVFGEPTVFGPARMIFYSWSERTAAALPRLAFESDRIAILPVDGGDPTDQHWQSRTVDPFLDYRRFWPADPPPIQAIGVMQDTDATGQAASVELRALGWRKRPGPAGR